jgi:hypothetical protein
MEETVETASVLTVAAAPEEVELLDPGSLLSTKSYWEPLRRTPWNLEVAMVATVDLQDLAPQTEAEAAVMVAEQGPSIYLTFAQEKCLCIVVISRMLMAMLVPVIRREQVALEITRGLRYEYFVGPRPSIR